tara:strand:+ start:614 stop:1162 length:549 start_codon:yes stop_codon:yes gene_type:complete
MLAINKPSENRTKISVDEIELYNLIMDYRKSKGLERIPLSNSLTIVAQTHCKDLANNKPDLKKKCNAHSWSANGKWSNCCYTPDHKEAECMWNKPNELTSYNGYGFEIAVGSSEPQFDDYIMTPEYAITSWKKSFHHNNVIINKDKWKDTKWNAIGIGIYKGFATVWFGKEVDSEGEPEKEK